MAQKCITTEGMVFLTCQHTVDDRVEISHGLEYDKPLGECIQRAAAASGHSTTY